MLVHVGYLKIGKNCIQTIISKNHQSIISKNLLLCIKVF